MINLIDILKEIIKNNVVYCDGCDWSWNLSDGGNDPYICHKCGHDNTPNTENKEFKETPTK
jgi:hypothetical protein